MTSEKVVQAATAGKSPIASRVMDTPIGRLLLVGTDQGLIRVAFEAEDWDAVARELDIAVGEEAVGDPAVVVQAEAQIAEYFAGTRRAFDLPVDLSQTSAGFRATVQQYLVSIDYGSTQTYKDVAVGVGNPQAVRAVGTACARNPLPLILPCHRVIRTDGGLGGYLGGVQAKKKLLDLEQTVRNKG